MQTVICIGSALVDLFLPTSDGVVIDTPDDVLAQRKIAFELGAKYRIEQRYTAPGGCALNVSIGLARLGIDARPYAVIGGDAYGVWIRDMLLQQGVKTDFLRQDSDAKSDLSVIIVDRKTGDRIVFVNRELQETLVLDANSVPQNAIIFVSALAADCARHYAEVVRMRTEKKCTIAFNPGQHNIANDHDAVMAMLAHTTYLFVNTDEAMEIAVRAGEKNIQSADPVHLMMVLHHYGAQHVIMTGGREGAWYYAGKEIYTVPAFGGAALDATGAGDALTSGVLAGLISALPERTALAWGGLNAGNVVQFYGAVEGLLTQREMRRRVHVAEHHVARLVRHHRTEETQ